ncbi:restriction endonuclease subunit S [Acinetobacter towneri]|uniref:restriction endonuclease subunit S n=1 Tax=Acinetobacter towneri TaxID=202956 RepID=UPI002934F2DE|nr:restriction endonuclease subunit S [Acinetobacter towneri]WOE28988.1 restriction endonuclease subunit S [Acinetobacter towneri]
MSFPKMRLDKVCRITMGQAPSGDSYNFDGHGLALIAGAGDFGKETPEPKKYTTAAGKRSEEGEIILCIRATIGDLNWSDKKYCLGRGVAGLFGHKDKLDQKYLWHWLKNIAPLLKSKGKGATFLQVTKEDICSLEIALPPLAEQHRIAAILDQADELRQKRQQAIEKLDQLLQATFIDMFGDPVSNPKGWDIFKSKSLFQAPPRIGTTTPANGEGIPVVRVGELGQFHIDFEKCGRVQISESDFKKYELKNGDLVLARAIGSKNQLGKCSYFSQYFEPVCIDSHVMRLRPDPKKMHPLWFYFLLSSDQGKKILQSKGGATAVQFNINSAQANDLDIALPPLSEQAKFVEIANKILKNKDSHIKSLEKNNLLFSSLQNQAFNGTL